MTRDDPIIEAIYKVRNKYAEQFGFDLRCDVFGFED